MKVVCWTLGILGLLICGVLALNELASERVEVVELHTKGESGEEITTRLWVVDHDGHPFLRAGHEQSGWLLRLRSVPAVRLTRNSETLIYEALPSAELRDVINKAMLDKYTWSDTLIGALLGRDDSIPVKLLRR